MASFKGDNGSTGCLEELLGIETEIRMINDDHLFEKFEGIGGKNQGEDLLQIWSCFPEKPTFAAGFRRFIHTS
ncbi:MAG TPA: hypothetical protein VLC28_08525 [Flavitalea sp.]|nr:hypothetical protein [Flavitalea sp.]